MSPVPPATSRTLKSRGVPRRRQQGDEIVLPQAVKSRRHQVVHLVIAFRNLGKDLVDEVLFLRFRHGAKAERRGFLGRVCHRGGP